MPKTEDEKAEEILNKRDLARKGISEQAHGGTGPLEAQDDREEKVEDAGLAVGLGLKR